MPTLRSAQPSPELRPYVRAYAQRNFDRTDLFVVEPVPAQLEQVLNFELGTLPGVRHRQYEISATAWIGGAQTSFPGYMDLYPGVESFAIFFQPTGWSQLFATPMREVTNRRVAQPSDAKPHRGCPILRGFLRRVGGRLMAPWGLAFHAACARNEIFLQPSFTRTGPDSSRK